MLSAAPRPRPPQPISPTLMASLPAAWTLPIAPRPTAAAVEVFRKSRREGEKFFEEVGSVIVRSPGARWDVIDSEGHSALAPRTRSLFVRSIQGDLAERDSTRTGRDPTDQRVPLPLTTCDLRPLRLACSFSGPDDPEPRECGVGVPPDALGTLRVLGAPFLVRAPAGRAAELLRVVVPRAAPDDVGILLGIRQD